LPPRDGDPPAVARILDIAGAFVSRFSELPAVPICEEEVGGRFGDAVLLWAYALSGCTATAGGAETAFSTEESRFL
jgi:hypothetical protein